MGENESDYRLTTLENGIVKFESLTNGTYYLKEVAAPDGYNSLTYEIVIEIKDGVITVERSDGKNIAVDQHVIIP